MQNSFIDHWHNICKNNKGRAMIMMSGSGSNAINIIKNRINFTGLEIVGLFSDNKDSRASYIGTKHGIESYIMHHGKFVSDEDRHQYFQNVQRLFDDLGINLLIYAGFMKIVPQEFMIRFPGINSHPADLLVKDHKGNPKYVGMLAIKEAILQGETSICCSCCIVDFPVDTGGVLGQSERICVSKEDIDNIRGIHEKLKEKEHTYYPIVIEKLCSGVAHIIG